MSYFYKYCNTKDFLDLLFYEEWDIKIYRSKEKNLLTIMVCNGYEIFTADGLDFDSVINNLMKQFDAVMELKDNEIDIIVDFENFIQKSQPYPTYDIVQIAGLMLKLYNRDVHLRYLNFINKKRKNTENLI